MISIVIPLYNAEKFIVQCLDSIRRQTFDDFEVIVVDDVSIDRSVEIVESIATTFDGRLRLIKRKKNFGGSAVPRNIGLNLARGKYIMFIDNDDLIMPDTLERLHSIAESTGADVLHASKWYEIDDDVSLDQPERLRVNTFELEPHVEEITVEPDDLSARMKEYVRRRYHWHVWNKFFRRDFLIEHEIEFPPFFTGEDTMFCFECLCRARRYVRIPNVFYVWRVRRESESHRVDSLERYMHKYMTFFVECSSRLQKIMDGVEFFERQPQYRYAVADFFIRDHLSYIERAYRLGKPHEVEALMKSELEAATDVMPLTAQLFHLASIYRRQLGLAQHQLAAKQQSNGRST